MDERVLVRFIPARAGNALCGRAATELAAVHPRACGERARDHYKSTISTGSSPRVRGTRRRQPRHHQRLRFIPARAGNASLTNQCTCHKSVHPRACGERNFPRTILNYNAGSSPRVRGTRFRSGVARRWGRFIPARAGNALVSSLMASLSAVHPRACGERARQQSHGRPSAGSSPRVRGTLSARIGKGRETGSSPRVRGTRNPVALFLPRMRFIPARAGNALPWPQASCSWPVHPRACGERSYQVSAAGTVTGSSPRVRGTLFADCDRIGIVRFIPARAGNARYTRRTHDLEFGSSPRVRGTRSRRN